MIPSSPLRPNLLKGALAVYPTNTTGAKPSTIIAFQFNPESMRRTLAYRTPPPPPADAKPGTGKEDVLRVAGPPVETINLTIEMHASDQLEDPTDAANEATALHGLHPALATLELLMYPSTTDAQKIDQQAAQGTVQLGLATVPLVLLVWGASRVVPVKLTSFSVSEDAFDTRLNPISAKVELGMQVLTYMEFTDSSLGRDAFISYQKSKESLALQNVSGSSAAINDLLPPRG